MEQSEKRGWASVADTKQGTESPGNKRLIRRLAGFFILAALLAAGTGALFVLHYRNLPRFETWLKSTRGDDSVAAWPKEARVLSKDGSWTTAASTGAVEQPDLTDELDFHFTVNHGSDSLLHWRQLVSLVYANASMVRARASTRTDSLTTHPDMHANARVYIHSVDRWLGPDSVGAGWVEVEVWLLQGAGPSEVVVLSAGDERCIQHAGAEIAPKSTYFPPFLDPTPELPASGLVHHFTACAFLQAKPRENGSSSAGIGAITHDVNTKEYSFAAQALVDTHGKPGGSLSRKFEWTSTLTWNGQVW